ncbi:hypothetical protein HYV83_00435 [Candidatus Woesearchaeota archaeon]|nr:hypothetical protein [Candidatus Woesearchaeota archaeon]
MNSEIIGLAAATLTSSAFLPQIIKGYKTKHLKDLSYGLTVLMFIGTGLWLIYGLAKKDIIIIAANVTSTSFTLTLILMKYYYGKNSMNEKNH